MTTSWAHFMRGQWLTSLRANPGGFLLAVQSVLSIAWLSFAAKQNRELGDWFWVGTVCGICLAMLAALVDWGLRLVMG